MLIEYQNRPAIHNSHKMTSWILSGKIIEHPYIIKEGAWKASGIFIDEIGSEIPVEGETKIFHGKNSRQNHGAMRLLPDPPERKYKNLLLGGAVKKIGNKAITAKSFRISLQN